MVSKSYLEVKGWGKIQKGTHQYPDSTWPGLVKFLSHFLPREVTQPENKGNPALSVAKG